mmetsp:Transcript_2429/g.3525  ORF Transcript_2429/g.3525 Transcript_2429/m.3525 type:complete len:111 (-) Transcript_2429:38-370(-)|eukprot:CAMPEP_0203793172 /NCGR_PEP_ID=MMETSP0100_2-20121128/5703_1 /ASSEMBLY_ACC=CAM_ASM_000210 /TAXON_ID=96639 /ORGANISM=" , Strain NY0313808BC1" /LENGTH=110 /DNA_ID=CAMNT_0050696893 /DNA_START=1915 /DNA_END=2247 /DNA_ORIENTATION=+
MIERLQAKYGALYSLPSEYEIQAAISSLFAKQKGNRELGLDNGKRGRPSRIPEHYMPKIEEIAPQWTPAKNHYMDQEGNIPDDFPPEASIKSKISSLRFKANESQRSQVI